MRRDGKKLYVDQNEISEDWGVSRTTAYRMIRDMNARLKKKNPNVIIIAGKVNRQFYEECCNTIAN